MPKLKKAAVNEHFRTTSGISKEAEVPENTIRDWENAGRLKCQRDSAGRRLFDAAAVAEAIRLRALSRA